VSTLNGTSARLVLLGPDGQPLGERVLAAGEALEVGRDAGPPWDDDAYLDLRHATLRPVDGGVQVDDHGSLNGVFVKLAGRVEVQNGDQFRVGQELLVYEELPEPTPTADGTERMGSPNPGYWGRVSVLVDPTVASGAFPIAGDGITVGRESGDVTFPHDGYVSGKHCRISGDDQGIYLEDLGSSNGTYMRVRSGQTVPFGSLVLIGQKLFQLERV
jgi:pSer/pThr/pTyr-binding forkhead associated (FHA) protein